MSNIFTSSCSLNCWDNCSLKVIVDDGKVIAVEGNHSHPITKGKICGRGRMLETRTNSPDRLLYPLKKVNGEFQQIPWETALTEISQKMINLKNTVGTTSILHSHDYANGGLLKNVDQRFFNGFGGVTEIIGSICWGSGIEAQTWDMGDAYSHAPDDLFNSRNIVVWGRNVARTNMHLYQALLEAKKKGANIYVIDPLYNATAKIADHHITVKPGMDGILAAGIMKILLQKGLADREFIEQHTVGFRDLVALLDTITLEEISSMTEVNQEIIEQLATVYSSRPTSTLLGLGMQRYQNGGNTIRLIDSLVAISGNIGISGGGVNYANRQVGQSFQLSELTLSHLRTSSRQFFMMTQAEQILTAKDPDIRMIIVTCGNPLTQVPHTSVVKEAFSSVETVVVFEQFMTDTAKLADYVLPVATVFEEEDVYYSSMYHHYANYGPKLVEAPGEAKSDLWIWTELAKRLGFGELFDYTREEFLQMGIQSLQAKGVTLEALREQHFAEIPVDHVPWKNYQFKTPSGKFEFTSSLAFEKGMDGKLQLSLPREAKGNEKYPYTLLTIHPLRSNHSQHFHLLKGEQKVKVEIAENIAKQLTLTDGDFVRVWNDRGEIQGFVAILKHAHPNTINIDEGIGAQFGGSVNALTSSQISDNSLGSTIYDCSVRIEKITVNE